VTAAQGQSGSIGCHHQIEIIGTNVAESHRASLLWGVK
jgi:hypothetical protein